MEVELIKTIGEYGGPIAVAAVVWMYLKVKGMEKRLDDGEARFKQHDQAFDDLKKSVDKMGNDISFIRGLMEGKNQKEVG